VGSVMRRLLKDFKQAEMQLENGTLIVKPVTILVHFMILIEIMRRF
jgi:hypothetical protein